MLLTIQYVLRIQFLDYFLDYCNYTPMYLASYIMLNRFPLSLEHLTVIVLDSDMAFNFVFSLN